MIFFYKSGDEDCKKLTEEYKALAEKMYGIIKVGAINCRDEEELCEEFTVYTVPAIIVFTENYNDEGEQYKGKVEWKALSSFATQKM